MLIDFKRFSRLYFVLLLLHLVVLYKEPESFLIYVTKPALLFSLIAFFLQKGFNKLSYYNKLFTFGLVCSLVGDFLLIRDSFFLPGLGAFLLAQLSYTFAFYRSLEGGKGFVYRFPLLAMPVLLFGFGLIFTLLPTLGNLAVPVIVYALVICLMVIMAINRKGNTSPDSFMFVLLGASLFVVSDSILAFDKFYTSYNWATIAVMLTYGLAQYFLMWGMQLAEKD